MCGRLINVGSVCGEFDFYLRTIKSVIEGNRYGVLEESEEGGKF